MNVIQFEIQHLKDLTNFGCQEDVVEMIDTKNIEGMKVGGPAFSVMNGNKIIACGGFIEFNKFRAMVWALMQRTKPNEFIHLHRAVLREFSTTTYKRLEAYVDPRQQEAMRWIKMLGFKMERAYVPYYFPDGSGASEWSMYPGTS